MDAESLAAFDDASLEAGEALWPGTLAFLIDNQRVEVPASVTLGTATVTVPDGQALGGLMRVQTLSARIRKAELPAGWQPETGHQVSHTADGVRRRWRVDMVSGHETWQAAWFIRAIQADT